MSPRVLVTIKWGSGAITRYERRASEMLDLFRDIAKYAADIASVLVEMQEETPSCST